jgi:enoyl-CoA hydratase/carnithine racemase
MSWRDIGSGGRRLLCGQLDLDILVIAAVNGPALIHSEIAVMADIVLACPEAEFADHAHFPRNVVPGDGVHLVWSDRLGPSRAAYFLLTGNSIDANEALRLGFVHELHAREQLLSRAHELAAAITEKAPAVIAYTRAALRSRERRGFREDLSYGLAIEGLGQHAIGVRGPEQT